jgi:malate dehydrogenase (oxaloacetate-decarboxylating)
MSNTAEPVLITAGAAPEQRDAAVGDDPGMDPTFLRHLGGKIEIRNKVPLKTRADLARAYTPGFARVAAAISRNPEDVYRFSIKQNAVAIVTDGTAVSGLGDVGPEAALPVMEGKALLFRELAGIDAFPLCLATKDVDEIVRVVQCIEPTFGAVMLEDISAPRCFEIEERLREDLTIPVLHDDQHATAVAATAALINAAKVAGKELRDLKVVIAGAGAAGTSSARLFMQIGVRNVIACDRQGAIHRGRDGLNRAKRWFADHTNPAQEKGSLSRVMAGADVFLGLSGPGVITAADIKTMAKDPIVFALANPIPEILPDEVGDTAAVFATGRSDYPNQIDCGLCYPGIFRGALDCRARTFNDAMKLAAAHAIAGMVDGASLSRHGIVPDIFDGVAAQVAEAVMQAAIHTRVARV